MEKTRKNSIVLFDGYCLLCEWSVKFILKRDRKKRFLFTSLQSENGIKLLKQFSIPDNYNKSVVLIENESVFLESDAALLISKNLRGLWPMLYVFIYLPKSFRDWIYRYISKNRFKWFTKKTDCYLPTSEERKRFL
jgi:predicted DCC family thiol-disulfide oxidoreductase YuxK